MSLAQQEESIAEFHPLDMLERSVEDHGWPPQARTGAR